MPPAAKTFGGKTVRQHAGEIGERPETVRRWLAQGMPPADPARAEWITEHRRRRHKRPKGELVDVAGDDAPEDLIKAKHAAELRYKQLKAELLDLQLQQRSGQLIEVDEAKRLQVRLAALIKAVFMELPVAVADLVCPEDPEHAREILRQAVVERLEQVATDQVDKPSD